jgi:tape measure domain-containing protein
VSIKQSITREDIRNFKNTVKSKLAGLSVDVKANVKGGGFAGSLQGAAGLMEFMQSQGMIGKTASNMEMRMKKGGDDLSRELNDAVKSAEKIKATFDGIAKSIATTGKTTANVEGKRLGLGNVPLMSGSIEKRIERAASSIEGTLSSNVLRLLYPEINKTISSFTALRGQVQQNASKLSGFSLIIGLAAFAGVPLAKSVVKLTGSANDFANLLDGLGPKLKSAFLKAASNILEASSTRLLTGGRLTSLLPPAAGPAGLLPPAYRGIGPSRNAGALPPAYRGIEPAAEPVGLLPRYTSRGTRDETMRQFGAGREDPGRLALTDEMVQRRSPIQAAKVREIFDPREFEFGTLRLFKVIGDALEQAAAQARKARIDRSIDELMLSIDNAIKVAQARVRIGRGMLTGQAQVSDLGRTVQPALPPTRIAGLLPPAAGRAPNVYSTSGESQSELFARREREARMRSVLRSVDVMGETPALRAPAPYSYANRPAMPRPPTSAIVPYSAGGALVPAGGGSGGAIPPRPPSGGGGGGMGGMANFGSALSNINLPGAGAVRAIGEEFSMAAKQVLLFGTAYKALAFITSFPAQVGQAVGALQSFNNTLKAISPTAEEAKASNQFILDIVDRYNVPLQSARDGFTKLYASMAPAGFKGDEIRDLFTSVSQAAATFGMSADKVDRVNYAFAQMASKGQVMSEELKGQLGDVLPGAMGIFAEAAGFKGPDAIQKFSKALEDGAFKGEAMRQLLKNVTIVMTKEFGPGAEGAARTFQGVINRMQNSTKLLYEAFEPVAVGFLNSVVVPLTSGIKTVADGFNAFFTGVNAKTSGGFAIAQELEKLKPTFEGIRANITALLPAFQSFANTVLGVGKVFLQIAGNPFVGYLARVYLNVLALTTAIQLLNLRALIPMIANFARSLYALVAFAVQCVSTGTVVQRLGMAVQVTGLMLRTFFATTGIGLVLVGIGLLTERFMSMNQALADTRAKALGAADAIRAMSQTEARQASQQYDRQAQSLKGLSKEIEEGKMKGKAWIEVTKDQAEALKSAGVTVSDVRGSLQVQPTRVGGAYQKVEGLAAEAKFRVRGLDYQDKQVEQQSNIAPITGTGSTGTGAGKNEKQSLESYHSLQDQLAKNFTQDQLDRMEKEYQSRVDKINAEFNLREARANSYQKEAIRFEKQMSDIELKRQKALLDASAEVIKAQGSVAGGAGGQSTTGATGLLQGSTGISSGAHFDVRRQDGSYISPEQAKALFDPSVRRQLAMTSAYGPRRAPVPGASTFHKGVDLAGPANTPLNLAPGFAMTASGEKGGLGYAASVRGPSGEMYDVGHLQRPKAGMGAPRKVTGDEKRDVIADQKTQLAIAQKSLAVQIAEAQAVRDAAVAWAEYTTSIAPIEEQKLQNSILAKKNDLVKLGMPDDVIEREMKHFETQQKTALAVEVVEQMLADKKISAEAATAKIAELNKRMADYNKLLGDNIELQRQQKFDANLKQLRDQIEALRVIGDEERRLFELRKEYRDDKKAQEIFDLEKIKKNIEDTRALIDGFVSQTSSDYKGFLKAVISGEDAVDALKQFQEGLKDRVLTIFLDFAMAPVEKFLKESLEGLFLPKAPKELKPEEEKAKTGIEGNTVATDKNTTALDNLTAALQGAGATSPTSTASRGGGGGIFDAANVFGGGGNLTGGIFDTISQQMGGATESLSSFSSHMGKFVDSSVASADAVGSWGDSFNTQLSESLTKATETTNTQGATFQESLGKAVGAIGIAAGAIMGIAAGISQIKKGGTGNTLMGIGSIMASVGGAIGGFSKLGKAANGAVWTGGFQAFANGGMVKGPTLGLIGEGKYNEAIVPLPDGRSIPVQMRGAGGSGSRDLLANQAQSRPSPSVLSMSFQSTTINGVEYVDRAQLEAAMEETRRAASREGANKGAILAIDRLANSPSSRRRAGIR